MGNCVNFDRGAPSASSAAKFSVNLCAAFIACGASSGYASSCALRALDAFGFGDAEVYASPSQATVCIYSCGTNVTVFRRVYALSTDLSVMERCTRILRLAESGATIDECEFELSRVQREDKIYLQSLGGGIACASFCAFFGGGLCESAICLLVGIVTCLLSAALSRRGAGGAARVLAISVLGGALSLILSALAIACKIECSAAYVVLGSIMATVPGLNIFGALRDLLSGDYQSAAERITGGLSSALAMAAGYSLSGAALSFLSLPHIARGQPSFLLSLASCAAGASGFCIMFRARPSRAASGVLAAASTYCVYCLCIPLGVFWATAIASFFAYFVAAALSYAFRLPNGMFLTSAILPLLPGAPLYYAAEELACGNFAVALEYGADAVLFFGAIAVGVAAAAAVLRLAGIFLPAAVRMFFSRKKFKLTAKKGYLFSLLVL